MGTSVATIGLPTLRPARDICSSFPRLSVRFTTVMTMTTKVGVDTEKVHLTGSLTVPRDWFGIKYNYLTDWESTQVKARIKAMIGTEMSIPRYPRQLTGEYDRVTLTGVAVTYIERLEDYVVVDLCWVGEKVIDV